MKKKPVNIVKAIEPKPEKPKRTAKVPEPERIKFEGTWEDAVDIALKASRPKKGWPK